MSVDITLQDLTFEPFFNISKHFYLFWSVINFLKCLYVTLFIVNRRLPPLAVFAIFTGVISYYLVQTGDFTFLLLIQLLDFLAIVFTVFTIRDGIFLLSLLSTTIYFLKPFAFVVDVFVVLFMAVDIIAVFLENSAYWSVLYLNCIGVSMAVAHMNSHGPAMYKLIPNCLFVWFFWAVSCGARNKMRTIPWFVATMVYVLSRFDSVGPIWFPTPPGFSKLTHNVIHL